MKTIIILHKRHFDKKKLNKIDNNINARPQSGIQESDGIFEILVEGGMTRFLAFFMIK